MRLLDAWALIYDNQAIVADFPDENSCPEYAILSHTWANEEVLFQDIALGPQHEIQPTTASLRAFNRASSGGIRRKFPTVSLESIITTPLTSSVQSTDTTSSDSDTSEGLPSDGSITVGTERFHDVLIESSIHSDEEGFIIDDTEYGPILSNHALNDLRCDMCKANAITSVVRDRTKPHVKGGWTKILNTCVQTLQRGLEYVWIDTCCIDKSSSAELSEAINSMFKWYQSARICLTLLADCSLCPKVDLTSHEIVNQYTNRYRGADVKGYVPNDCTSSQLVRCRWFTRGWTLQELIAPRKLHFFDQNWSLLARRSQIIPTLQSITGIDGAVLSNTNSDRKLHQHSVAYRMSWARKRKTTRLEDEAYCLLGIFDTNMPLIYGEGKKAFRRLQEEIIKTSRDQSIFAWECRNEADFANGLFAPSPAYFYGHARDIFLPYAFDGRARGESGFRLTNEGMEIELLLDRRSSEDCHDSQSVIAHLDCEVRYRAISGSYVSHGIGLRLCLRASEIVPSHQGTINKTRVHAQVDPMMASTISNPIPARRRLVKLPSDAKKADCYTQLLIYREAEIRGGWDWETQEALQIDLDYTEATADQDLWHVFAAYPTDQYNAAARTMALPLKQSSCAAIAIRRGDGFSCILVVHYDSRSVCENDLASFCERASLFERKDYFEHSKPRRESHKFVLLPNGDALWAGFVPRELDHISPACQGLRLYVRPIGGYEASGPFAEFDYFQLERMMAKVGSRDRSSHYNLDDRDPASDGEREHSGNSNVDSWLNTLLGEQKPAKDIDREHSGDSDLESQYYKLLGKVLEEELSVTKYWK